MMDLNVNQLIAQANMLHKRLMDDFNSKLNHRLTIGIKDFTLDISRIVSSVMDIKNTTNLPVLYAHLAVYSKTYDKYPELQPVIWEEVHDVMINNVLRSGLTELSERSISLVNLFSENFQNYHVDAKNLKGETLLMAATGSPSATTPLIKLLLSLGADVNAETNDGVTPLHYLLHNARPPHIERFNLLVSAGVNPADPRPFITPSDGDFYVKSPNVGEYDSFEACFHHMRESWIQSRGKDIVASLDEIDSVIQKFKNMKISLEVLDKNSETGRVRKVF